MANEVQLRIRAISDFSDVQSNVQNIQQYLSKLNLPPNLKKNFENIFGNFEKEAGKFQKLLDGGLKSKGDITGLEKSGTQISNMLMRLKNEVDKLQNEDLGQVFKNIDFAGLEQAQQRLQGLEKELNSLTTTNLTKLQSEAKNLNTTMGKSQTVKNFAEALKSGDFNAIQASWNKVIALKEKYYKDKPDSGFNTSFEKLDALMTELSNNPAMKNLKNEIDLAEQELRQLAQINLDQGAEDIQRMSGALTETAGGAQRVTNELVETKTAARGLSSEVDMLKSQVSYFFGLTNAVMLFRRALTEALETVKELDAVMTEMSVVTDLNVGDYWDQLPEYSKRAKELGVSIKDAYSAATLYYQQGLKTNEVVAVSSETLKMARIAGMEAKEATDMMTAALRGFNMEINETSAQRINDVYSELAAVTASDTEEIATAMTKTASIAASANMEFETTSALLAQIIETTREAPETAGTAMKTIIARFTEVKELFSEGQLTGTDEEGEAININKIDAALKSVGMSLSGFLQGTQGIDDIFLELASKWDSLDIATQRYIATMAAGSRQQSRFLAMMSDYDRTMELVEAANNSSGASQEQFNKTLDSLETKLNKLSVAWDTFVMGIANNDLIKFGVDTLTGLLDTINKIINVASGGSGVLKSFFSIGTVAAGLALGKAAFNGIFKQIGAAMAVGAQQTGTAVGAAMGKSMYNSLNASLMATAAKFKAFSLKNFLITPKVNFAGFAADFKLTGSILTKETARMNAVTAKYDKMMLRHKQILDSTTASNYAKANSERQVAMIESTYSKIRADSEYRVQQALMSLGITEAQYDLIQKHGNNDDRLAIIMSNEKAKAYFLEKIAQGELTKEKYEEIVAESLVIHRRKMGIATQAKYYAMLLFGGDVARETALKQLGLATATEIKEMADKGATISQHGFNAALYACPLGWYALGIAAVVGAIALLAKATETSEETQKRLNSQLEEAQTAANSAKESYNTLEESISELSDKRDELDTLTEGTNEWKKALIEVNNQVLELLSKYPQLAQYLKTDENGILTFDEEGAQQVLSQQQEQVQKTQSIALGAEAQIAAFKALPDNHYLDNVASVGSSISFEVVPTEETMVTDQIKRDTALLQGDLEIANLFKSYLISAMSDGLRDSGYSNDITSAFGNIGAREYDDRFEVARDPYEGIKSKKKLRSLYEQKTGQEADENWTRANLRDKMANLDVFEQTAKGMEDFYDKFADLNKDQQQHLIAAVTKGGEKYSKKLLEAYDIESLIDDDGISESDITNLQKQIMEQTGITDEAQLLEIANNLGYDTIEEYIKSIAEGMVNASENQDQIFAQFGDFGKTGRIRTLSENENLSTGALQGLSDQLYDVFLTTSDPKKVHELAGSINEMMEGMSVEDAEAFATQLGDIDWSSVDSVEGLSEQLKSLGVSVDETQIEELEKQIIDFADAADNLTFEEAKADMKELKELSEAMADQEGYVFTEELKDQLIEAGKANADDFVMTDIDEWVYIGGSMEELLRSIEGDTDAILGELAGSLEDRAAEGAKWEAASKGETQEVTTTNGTEELSVTEIVEGLAKGTVAYETTEGTSSNAMIDAKSALDVGELTQLAVEAGIATEAGLTDWTPEQIVELLVKSWQDSYGVNGAVYEQTQAEQRAVAASAYANTNPFEQNSNKNQNTYGFDLELIKGDQIDAYKDGRIAAAKAVGASEDVIKAFEEECDAAKATGRAVDKLTMAELENEIEKKKSIKQTKKSIEQVNELTDGYTKASEMAEESKLDLADSFLSGLDNISEEDRLQFVDDYFNEITNYANGSYDAVNTLANEILRLANLDLGYNLEIDAESGEVDLSSLYNSVNGVLEVTEEAKAVVDKLVSSGLYEVEYETVKTKAWADFYDFETGKPLRRYYWSETSVPKLKVKGKNNYNEGFKSTGGAKSGGGGGSDATNDYDRHYNLDQDINAELREREKLEKEYQDLLEKRHASGEELHKITLEELASLERQKELQEEMLKRRKEDLKRTLSENSKYSEYAKYNYEDQTIEINWDKLDKLAKSNPDKYEEVSEFISELEEEQGLIQDCEDAIEDTEDAIYEVNERGKDEFGDLQDRVVEALIKLEQDLIDEQEKINESIDEASSDLMDAIQSNIDKFRQDRDNKKTEESIAEKERRLAYLRQDTSGANAMEIKKLEEELADEKESYGDTLIDQAMENLQEQNDAAAEQRERQIELQKSQLDYAEKFGLYNDEALRLMKEGIMNGHISKDSELYKVLDKAEGVAWMTDMAQADWYKNLQQTVSQAYVYAMTMSTDTDYMAEMIKQFEKNGGIVDAEIKHLNALRNLKIAITGEGTPINDEDLGAYLNLRSPKKGYMGAIQDRYASNGGVIDQQIIDWNDERNKKIAADPTSKQKQYTIDELEAFLKGGGNNNGGNTQAEPEVVNPPTEPAKPATSTTREYTIKAGDSLSKIAKNELGNMSRWKEIADLNGLKKPYTIYAGKKLKLPAYKTGGLANFTGPAWLDGTKSKPELVLNARDTENFILLKDVLSSLLHLPKNNQNSAPNSNYFDIDVKVDEVGNDYDVDRMIDRVKEKIYEDSMYRNVNSLNLLR